MPCTAPAKPVGARLNMFGAKLRPEMAAETAV
jgi:hypothetical protein